MIRAHRGIAPIRVILAAILKANRRTAITLAVSCLFLGASIRPSPAGAFGLRRDAITIGPMSGVSLQSSGSQFNTRELQLPGSNGLVTLDYFAWDRSTRRLWVPAGNLAGVDVIDGKTDEITKITGFHTAEFELRGKRVILGPTSVSIGNGAVYVGNRADSSICTIDARTLKLGDCIRIASPSDGLAAAPDGVVYVAPTKELWVTRGAPPLGIASPDQSITVLDASAASKLKPKTKFSLGGSAEGYAVDERRGLFYTNLEETGQTIAIDIRRHEIVSRWRSGCDEPRGLALDKARGFLFVACSDRVVSLDVAHGGQVVGSIATGDGLDNIDYAERQQALYAAASKAATLTIARVDDQGRLSRVAVVPTATGARGVVADGTGTAYVADPVHGRILKITPH
jgi:DNA-binding beta-propeller fold protein YncE